MKKVDEMDMNIKLRSEELGFKVAILVLTIWTLFECWKKFFNNADYNPLPSFILLTVLCAQMFSEMAMKRKMISGDEEYRESNKILWIVIVMIIIITIVLSVGYRLLVIKW